MELIMVFGIPGAITGFAVWMIQRMIKESEKKRQEKEHDLETLIFMMVQRTRANSIGIQAIARAVQRIPDAKCNGDMTAALAEMDKIQKEEKTFLIDKGIKYILE